MSAIYIRGMQMPTNKYGEVFVIYPNGEVRFQNSKEYQAVSVPAHGRLIDADALAEEHRVRAYKGMTENSYSFHTIARAWVNDAPTIIPADKEAET